MPDTKYSGLAQVAPKPGDIFAVDQTGTSQAVTVSSVAKAIGYDFPTSSVSYLGASSQINLQTVVTQPTSTAASTVILYGRSLLGGLNKPSFQSYAGIERPWQSALYNDSMFLWYPTTSAPGRVIGGDSFNIGSFSSAAATVGNTYTTKKRGVYKTASNTANGAAGMGSVSLEYFQGSTSGYGGYLFFCRFGLDTFATSTRYFVGLTATNASTVASSNTAPINSVGFRFIDTVTTWGFYHASTGTGTTETFTGQTGLASGNGYDIYIYAPANSSVIYYRLDELNTGSTIVNSSVANHLPNSTAFMNPIATVGALNTSTNAGAIGVIKMYCESNI